MKPLVRIPEDKLREHIGRKVHVFGWPAGCQFVLRDVAGVVALLETPTSKRTYRVSTDLLCYLRKAEP